MLARSSRMQGDPNQIEKTVAIFQESTDLVQQLPGFGGAYLLVDRGGGGIVSLTFWNSDADLDASATIAESIMRRASELAGIASPPQVETYEVLGEV